MQQGIFQSYRLEKLQSAGRIEKAGDCKIVHLVFE